MQIIFPSDYLEDSIVDEVYKEDYEVCNSLGYDTGILSTSKLDDNIISIRANNLDKNKPVLYRGWMLSKDKYELLCNSLKLINNLEEYLNCHYFSKSYEQLKNFSQKVFIYSDLNKEDFYSKILNNI